MLNLVEKQEEIKIRKTHKEEKEENRVTLKNILLSNVKTFILTNERAVTTKRLVNRQTRRHKKEKLSIDGLHTR